MVKGQANALPLVLLLIKGYRVRLLARLPSPLFMQRPAHAASIRGTREHCQDMQPQGRRSGLRFSAKPQLLRVSAESIYKANHPHNLPVRPISHAVPQNTVAILIGT